MADLSPEQQDYAAIELLYSEGRWLEVLQRSEALLAALTPQQQPLQARLNLVIGHALLYGLGDRPGAEQRYQAVQQDFQEPVLLEIAEQGLKRCREPLQPAAATPQPDPAQPDPAQHTPGAMPWDASPAPIATRVQETGTSSADAMPWMVELGAEPALEPAEETARQMARETLSLLRRPDELQPVTVQVLEEFQASPGQEDEDLSRLARGLLEVELR